MEERADTGELRGGWGPEHGLCRAEELARECGDGRGLSEGNPSVLLASLHPSLFLFLSHCVYLGISSAT